ncbi:carboxypeptidase B-like [Ptychodera flava]|uniref:carboxypeptidase B-like n=1 Tax=Ptychodera flava TaxID=63121 RepID=UPI00396A6558
MLRLVLLSICLATCLEAKSYEGYQVLRLAPLAERDLKALNPLQEMPNLDFWNFPRDLMVPPSQLESVKEYLDISNIEFDVWIPNVQSKIDAQFTGQVSTDSFNYGAYHTLNEIYDWIDSMVADYPNLASKSSIGTSHEGRDLTVLKIGADTGKPKRNVWFNSLIHAREWVSGAACMYMANRLMSEFSTEEHVVFLLETFDFYYLPVTNPDGYVYTWEGDRMWRKTRSPNSGSFCVGTDGNRNFDFMWGERGSSRFTCSSTYRGSSALSEPETEAVAAFVRSKDFDIFLDYHAYSELMLSSWGYTSSLPDDYDAMHAAMKETTDAIFSIHGKAYHYGPSGPTLYATSGTTVDWGYGDRGIVHSYTFELRDTGEYGFALPEDQIIPTGEENYAGFVALCVHVARS